MLASRHEHDSQLREFAAQAGELQRTYRHDADALCSLLQDLSQRNESINEALEASRKAMAQLGASTKSIVVLSSKSGASFESLAEMLGSVQGTMHSVAQSAGVIATRLEHVLEISREAGNAASETLCVEVCQERLLRDASQAVERYTVEERARAA